MIQVPIWVISSLVLSVFAAGFSVGWFSLKFVSKVEFEVAVKRLQDNWTQAMGQCQALRTSELEFVRNDVRELNQNRKEVWAKIDMIVSDTTEIKTTNARIETKLDTIVRGVN